MKSSECYAEYAPVARENASRLFARLSAVCALIIGLLAVMACQHEPSLHRVTPTRVASVLVLTALLLGGQSVASRISWRTGAAFGFAAVVTNIAVVLVAGMHDEWHTAAITTVSFTMSAGALSLVRRDSTEDRTS